MKEKKKDFPHTVSRTRRITKTKTKTKKKEETWLKKPCKENFNELLQS